MRFQFSKNSRVASGCRPRQKVAKIGSGPGRIYGVQWQMRMAWRIFFQFSQSTTTGDYHPASSWEEWTKTSWSMMHVAFRGGWRGNCIKSNPRKSMHRKKKQVWRTSAAKIAFRVISLTASHRWFCRLHQKVAVIVMELWCVVMGKGCVVLEVFCFQTSRSGYVGAIWRCLRISLQILTTATWWSRLTLQWEEQTKFAHWRMHVVTKIIALKATVIFCRGVISTRKEQVRWYLRKNK